MAAKAKTTKTKKKAKATRTPVVTKLKKKPVKHSFSELRPVKIYDFRLIPRYLFHQVKGGNWDFESILGLNDAINATPFNFLFVFVDDDNIIKGFLWGTLNPVTLVFDAFVFSVDKKYQGGDVLECIKGFLTNLMNDLGIKQTLFSTTRPKALEKAGFVRSKSILMEFNLEE